MESRRRWWLLLHCAVPTLASHEQGSSSNSSLVAFPPPFVRLGLLLPMFFPAAVDHQRYTESTLDAAYLALREINNKEDGVADKLLPRTQLHYSYRDSQCDATRGIVGTFQLTSYAFGGAGVSAIIGAECSESTLSAARVVNGEGTVVPIVSGGAMTEELSAEQGNRYPSFFRTVPTSVLETRAMVDILVQVFNYTEVALAYSSDKYGTTAAAAFRRAAAENELVVRTLNPVPMDACNASNFAVQYHELKTPFPIRAVALLMHAQGARCFLPGFEQAFEGGVAGEGFFFLGGNTLAEDFWSGDTALAKDNRLRLAVLKGLFAVRPKVDRTRYEAYMARKRALPSVVRNASWVTPDNPNGCSLEMDDDGHYLWAADHDTDSRTPIQCAGVTFQEDGIFDAFAYDAVYVVAHGLHYLLYEQNMTYIESTHLMHAIQEHVDFDGVTGRISFAGPIEAGTSSGRGDRRFGIGYTLVNYVDNNQTFVSVGSWSEIANSAAGDWSSRWERFDGQPFTYSTADNSKPTNYVQLRSDGDAPVPLSSSVIVLVVLAALALATSGLAVIRRWCRSKFVRRLEHVVDLPCLWARRRLDRDCLLIRSTLDWARWQFRFWRLADRRAFMLLLAADVALAEFVLPWRALSTVRDRVTMREAPLLYFSMACFVLAVAAGTLTSSALEKLRTVELVIASGVQAKLTVMSIAQLWAAPRDLQLIKSMEARMICTAAFVGMGVAWLRIASITQREFDWRKRFFKSYKGNTLARVHDTAHSIYIGTSKSIVLSVLLHCCTVVSLGLGCRSFYSELLGAVAVLGLISIEAIIMVQLLRLRVSRQVRRFAGTAATMVGVVASGYLLFIAISQRSLCGTMSSGNDDFVLLMYVVQIVVAAFTLLLQLAAVVQAFTLQGLQKDVKQHLAQLVDLQRSRSSSNLLRRRLPPEFASLMLSEGEKQSLHGVLDGRKLVLIVEGRLNEPHVIRRFVQLDASLQTLRWSFEDFIGLDQILKVTLSDERYSTIMRHMNTMMMRDMNETPSPQQQWRTSTQRASSPPLAPPSSECSPCARPSSSLRSPSQRLTATERSRRSRRSSFRSALEPMRGSFVKTLAHTIEAASALRSALEESKLFLRKAGPTGHSVQVDYLASDGSQKRVVLHSSSSRVIDTWYTGITTALRAVVRPRLAPSTKKPIMSWMRNVFEATDKSSKGFIYARQFPLLLAAANVRVDALEHGPDALVSASDGALTSSLGASCTSTSRDGARRGTTNGDISGTTGTRTRLSLRRWNSARLSSCTPPLTPAQARRALRGSFTGISRLPLSKSTSQFSLRGWRKRGLGSTSFRQINGADEVLPISRVQSELLKRVLGPESSTVRALYQSYVSGVQVAETSARLQLDRAGESGVVMPLTEWLRFQRDEQYGPGCANADRELDRTLDKVSSEREETLQTEAFLEILEAGREGRDQLDQGRDSASSCDSMASLREGITCLEFQSLLLSRSNRALCPYRSAAIDFSRPMTHYWASCSHNSFLEGLQIFGKSSDAIYARLLLQGCRSLEIDCWDGHDGKPDVTHGHAFCSRVKFRKVIIAINTFAFKASPLPVSLSLEMHCCPKQQRMCADLLQEILGPKLFLSNSGKFMAEELSTISPQVLNHRVLVKCKIVPLVRGRVEKAPRAMNVQRGLFQVDTIRRVITRFRRNRQDCITRGTSEVAQDNAENPGLVEDKWTETEEDERPEIGEEEDSDQDSFVASHETEVIQAQMSHALVTTFRKQSKRATTVYQPWMNACGGSLVGRQVHDKTGVNTKRKRAYDPRLVEVVTMPGKPFDIFKSPDRKGAQLYDSYGILPVTSISESKLEQMMGREERNNMQRLTLSSLGRAFPLGTRTDSSNMDPRLAWRCGVQMCALNLQTNDRPTQLHHALFELDGGLGYVQKPREMCISGGGSWPPLRSVVTQAKIQVLSLHHLPTRTERRPSKSGPHGASHAHVPSLSEAPAPPQPSVGSVSSPAIGIEVYPIAGFACVSEVPRPPLADTSRICKTATVEGNGLFAHFRETFYCLSAEPWETILRINVLDGDTEVAYETAVMGALRPGYRCFHLRSMLGTRIALCSLLVHISFDEVPHLWPEVEDLREQLERQQALVDEQATTITQQQVKIEGQNAHIQELQDLLAEHETVHHPPSQLQATVVHVSSLTG